MCICVNASAFDKRALTDTLNNYVNEQVKVGKIKVTRVLVRDDNVSVYTEKKVLSSLTMTPEQVSMLRRIVSVYVLGKENGNVLIFTDGREISELIPQRYLPHEASSAHYTLPKNKYPLTSNQDRKWRANRGLDGIHIALYGSHGIYFNQATERWIFQRAKLLTTVEDLYTSSFTMPYLVPMLENAGAVVLQPRERDTQTNEVIVDDREVSLSGAWKESSNKGWGEGEYPLIEHENPFTIGRYATSAAQNSQENSTRLSYEPDITERGEYAVYVSYKSLSTSSESVEYEIIHSGQHTIFHVNQRMGGGTWIYLGTFLFNSNDKEHNRVLVSNFGKHGETITSDAIRFGGGMGSVGRYRQPDSLSVASMGPQDLREEALTSGYPRYIEGARYWLQYSGIPDSVYNYSQSKNDYPDDYASRGRWINWLTGGSSANPKKKGLNIPVHLGLAFHSDAGFATTDSIVGTLIIYTDKNIDSEGDYPTNVSRLSARSYGDYIQSQIVEDIQALYAPEWKRRELKNANYSETRNPDIPMVILELQSHQHLADMRYGHDPRFKFTVSRAIYKGMLKYLHEQYGTDYTVQPLPVKNFNIQQTGVNELRLSWEEQEDKLEKSAKPSYYVVYMRTDDGDWDNGRQVNKKEWKVEIEPDKCYDFYVVAGNRGGISMRSEILSAGISSVSQGKVLVVNGFTRVGAPESFCFDSLAGFSPFSHSVPYGKDVSYIGSQYEFNRRAKWVSDDDCGFGASHTDYAHYYTMGNTFDYPVLHGRALMRAGYSYVSSSLQSVGDSIDGDYTIVDLILGKQKESRLGVEKSLIDFKVLPTTLCGTLRNYCAGGGNVLVSGAYISSDMRQTEEEIAFVKEVLHCQYVTQSATRSGNIRTQKVLPREVVHLKMLPNSEVIHCENPDGIKEDGDGAFCVARYEDSSVGAGVAYEGDNKTLVYAFPLESCKEFEHIYIHSIKWLTK